MTDKTFGAWLKLHRIALDLSQQELADQSGCSVVTIRKIESDERKPSKELAELIGRSLSVPEVERSAFVSFARNEGPQANQLAFDDAPWKSATPAVHAQFKIDNRHHLPAISTLFVGREAELTKLGDLLADPAIRLLTIVGPGGIGKTQLALAVAQEQVANTSFPDGVYFVSLAPLSEPAAIIPAIAEAAGYPFQNDGRSSEQQLFDYCQQKTMLLLLDNFEHLLDGATLIADLLQQAPHVKVLVTSRERLNLYEEQRYLLQGLMLPDLEGDAIAENAAVTLFVQSVRRGQPDFALAPDEFPHVVDICRLVEGMPLGLELAASWVEMLSLREIVTEIQQSLDFLETELRNVPARHRSMRAVFDRSWQGLREAEQVVYAQLSVFRGGFTSEAAKAVTETTLHTLARFVNKSLLRYSQRQKRYEIHELLRQYAAEHLEQQTFKIPETSNLSAARDHHTAYYCAFLQQREADLKGSRQQEALAEIEADRENVSIAWQWAVEQTQITQLEQALVSFALFCQWYGHLREGETMCRIAAERLAIPLADTEIIDQSPASISQARLLVKLLTWQGVFNIALTQREMAQQALQQAQKILDGPILRDMDTNPERAFLLLALSDGTKNEDLGGDALALNEQSLALYRQIDDRWGIAYALELLSLKHQSAGNHSKAVKFQEECLAIRQQLNDPRGIAKSYSLLGHMVLFAGQIEVSERYLRKSLALFGTMDHRADLVYTYEVLHINLNLGGKFSESVASAEACLAILEALGIPHESSTASVGMVRSKVNLGLYEEARQQSETDFIKFKALNLKWKTAFTLFNLGRIDLAEGDVRQALTRFQESVDILQKMNNRPLLPDVLFCLGYTFRSLGDRQQMVDTLIEALKMVLATGPPAPNPLRFELPFMALLLADQGGNERAVEFYAAAFQSPYIANSRWFEEIAGRHIAEVAATLPLAVVEAAQERGRRRDLWKTATEVLAELERGDWSDGSKG
ncbi:helix-turn-helix domain-containing protein [Chloroflexi bacterium TSY]|nr:helix-turn-helix domain-containing protein [Chloroflexi bacterium TSY]